MLHKTLHAVVSGLIPYESYTYTIEKLDSNWPVYITPISGHINPTSHSANIDSKVYFCDLPSTSHCPGYFSVTSGLYSLGDDIFVDAKVKLESPMLDHPIYSDTISVTCSGCISVPNISVASNLIQLTSTNDTALNITFSNLKPYTTYNYSFNEIDSNFPVVLTNIPKSGSFTSSSLTSHTLRADLAFCHYEDCTSPTFGSGYNNQMSNLQCETYYTNFDVSLDSDYLVRPVISNSVKIECDNCLPKLSISTPSSISLTSSTLNKANLSTTIGGLKPHTRYDYTIKHIESDHKVSFSSLSGYFYTKNENTRTINTDLAFCLSSDRCDHSNSLGAIVDYDCSKPKYMDLYFELDSDCLDFVVNSDTIRLNCNNCLPKTTSSLPSKLSLTTSNIVNITGSFNGLTPNVSYSYNLDCLDSNWPSILKPVSGNFIATSNSENVVAQLMFCSPSGNCVDGTEGLLSYSLDTLADRSFNQKKLHTDLVLNLTSECGDVVSSKKCVVECNNCLPKIAASLPARLPLTLSNIVNVTGSFNGLTPNVLYNYSFNGIDSNWPSILKPSSGSFVATSTTENVVAQLMFCSPSGNCVDGTEGLLDYTLDTLADKDFNQKKLHTDLVLNLTSEYGDGVVSKKCIIECDDCLPCVRHANVLFENSPIVTLDSSCCVGQKLLRVNVTNAIAGDRYTYHFDSVYGIGVNNITFNPSSGEIYFGSGGVGVVNTICNVDLVDHTQTILNFELTHTDSNTKALDSLVLVCNNRC